MIKKYYSNELYHFGILGQKWGVRRYQNEDGSLTSAGKQRYSYSNKENFIQKRKRIYSAKKELKTISNLHGKERQKAQSKYKGKYGFSYTNASIFGAKTADKIARNAYKKGVTETKATCTYLGRKIGIASAALTGSLIISKYALNHPKETIKAMKSVVNLGRTIADKIEPIIREASIRLNPNIINAEYTTRECLNAIGDLPLKYLA